jgi:hypothetical protein
MLRWWLTIYGGALLIGSASAVTFFLDGADVDPDYKAIRDREHCKPYRTFVEYLWARYKPSGDGNDVFLGDAKKYFRQRFWEMYLFCALEDRGVVVQKTMGKGGGPDFSFRIGSKRYWVEAISPTAGSESDKVPYPVLGGNYVPRELILLRYTIALDTKFKCWPKWVDKNIVCSDDGYIVAINGLGIPDADCGFDYPYIIQSLFPVGPFAVKVNINSLTVSELYLLYQGMINKQNGALVNTAPFIDKKYSAISAIIHSFAGFTSDSPPFGGDFILVHNPLARHLLPVGSFPWFMQYSFENAKLTPKEPTR